MSDNRNLVKNRYEFMALIEARMCNPNGDPDKGNEPRRDPMTDVGIITDVATKRWIRNYLQDAYNGCEGCEIMMQQGTSVNKKIAEAVFEANGVKSVNELPGKKNTKTAEAAEIMAKQYWDVRAFGGVMSTGLNAGQIKGAVQIAMSTSVGPVETIEFTITRMCYADKEVKNANTIADYVKEEQEHPEDAKRTMGNKWVVPYGLYVFKGTVSASLAEKVGFTEDDLSKLWEAIMQMLEHNVSSSKTGMSLVTPLIIFKHVGTQAKENAEQNAREAKLGCAPAHKLFEMLKVERIDENVPASSVNDFNIVFCLDKLPNGVEVGIKTAPFAEVNWGSDAFRAGWEFDLEV